MMQIMTASERTMPPLNGDERTTLESWLDFYRDTLAMKCQDLDEEQLRQASVAPSSLTLLGLVQHMAEVERNWFRRVLVGEEAPPIYPSESDSDSGRSDGRFDGGFDLTDDGSFGTALATWHTEVSLARGNCASRALDGTSPYMGGEVTLRWIYVHMIAEYARHNGHADLVRERIDGRTGV